MCYRRSVNDISDIGSELVRAREAAGLTQRQLAERLGVKQPQVARWESSAYRTTSLERVAAVARALGFEPTAAAPIAAETAAAYATALPGTEAEALAALAKVGVQRKHLVAFARSHGITRLELFGSILTDDFGPASDVDVLVTYSPDRTPSLMGAADHEMELAAIMRRGVDLVTRASVERSENRIRRDAILGSARSVYAAR